MSDDQAEREAREAAALAAALGGAEDAPIAQAEARDLRGSAPVEAVEAAALVRLAKAEPWSAGETDERARRFMLESEASFAARRRAHERRVQRWRLGGLLAACLLGALLATTRPWSSGRPEPLAASALPAPGEALLLAQLSAAAGEEGARDRLSEEMRGYRMALYSSLSLHYEASR